ncbi:MAG: MFS transporter permease [Desulfobacterales bacterium]
MENPKRSLSENGNTSMKEIVVPREKAVFWMDENGRWHNRYGPFQKPKIVAHFNASIRKDRDGYHVTREYDNIREKVYFPYVDTPLFVFDVIRGDHIILVMNTKNRVPLRPENLFTKDDNLFMRIDSEWIKFTDRALLKLADCIGEDDGKTVFRLNGRSYSL